MPAILHTVIADHLAASDECGAALLERDRFVRHGRTFILPESAHLKQHDNVIQLIACNPEGTAVVLVEWQKTPLAKWEPKDKAAARAALVALNPQMGLRQYWGGDHAIAG